MGAAVLVKEFRKIAPPSGFQTTEKPYSVFEVVLLGSDGCEMGMDPDFIALTLTQMHPGSRCIGARAPVEAEAMSYAEGLAAAVGAARPVRATFKEKKTVTTEWVLVPDEITPVK